MRVLRSVEKLRTKRDSWIIVSVARSNREIMEMDDAATVALYFTTFTDYYGFGYMCASRFRPARIRVYCLHPEPNNKTERGWLMDTEEYSSWIRSYTS
jgi:hypothetical protein